MKNTTQDLLNHLFCEMERLNDEDLKGEELKEELGRARGIKETASAITEIYNTVVEVEKLRANSLDADYKVPKMLDDGLA